VNHQCRRDPARAHSRELFGHHDAMEAIKLRAFAAILGRISDAEQASRLGLLEQVAWDPPSLLPFLDERHHFAFDEAADTATPLGMGLVHVRAGRAEIIKCQSHGRDRGCQRQQVKPSRGGRPGLAFASASAICE